MEIANVRGQTKKRAEESLFLYWYSVRQIRSFSVKYVHALAFFPSPQILCYQKVYVRTSRNTHIYRCIRPRRKICYHKFTGEIWKKRKKCLMQIYSGKG